MTAPGSDPRRWILNPSSALEMCLSFCDQCDTVDWDLARSCGSGSKRRSRNIGSNSLHSRQSWPSRWSRQNLCPPKDSAVCRQHCIGAPLWSGSTRTATDMTDLANALHGLVAALSNRTTQPTDTKCAASPKRRPASRRDNEGPRERDLARKANTSDAAAPAAAGTPVAVNRAVNPEVFCTRQLAGPQSRNTCQRRLSHSPHVLHIQCSLSFSRHEQRMREAQCFGLDGCLGAFLPILTTLTSPPSKKAALPRAKLALARSMEVCL